MILAEWLTDQECESGQTPEDDDAAARVHNAYRGQPTPMRRSIRIHVNPEFGELLSALKNQVQFVAVVRKIPALKTIASELFLGEIDVEFECDPEIEDSMYVVFRVRTSGELKEVAALRREWYARTFGLLGPSCGKVRLSIDIRQ